jgi:hypothetical protein
MNRWVFKKSTVSRAVLLAAVPITILGVLWATRSNEATITQLCLSFVLICFPWQAYMHWRRGGRDELPLFGMISAMYCLYYAVPMFWGDLTISSDYAPSYELPNEAITQALLMAAGGVAFLWLGMKCHIGRRHIPRAGLIALRPTRLNYIRFVLIAGSLLSFSDFSTYALGAGGRQAIVLLLSMIPLLAFAILFRRYLQGEATTLDRLLIAGFLMSRFLAGMASGWLGVFTSILVICGSLYVAERKRIPRLSLFVVVAFTLFFQVGKDDFRKTYWVERFPPAGRVERLVFWVDTSFEKWNEVLTNPSADTLREIMSPSVNRLSLLNQTANVIDKTPALVPYQYGQLYSYMFITLIPRFIWPDKPSVNDANQYYQVAYGLTSEDNLGGVSIAVGVLTEGFMNFGWVGAFGIMFLIGIFFDFYQSTFLSRDSGILLTALGVVLLPQFLAVESQMAQYLGGIVQQVLFTLLIMSPALKFGRRAKIGIPANWQYAQK